MNITSRKVTSGQNYMFLIGDIKWKHKNMHLSQIFSIPKFDPFCNGNHGYHHQLIMPPNIIIIIIHQSFT